MATSKGKGGPGRPRAAATVATLALAESAAGFSVEPKDAWRKGRTVYVCKDGTVSASKRKDSEPLVLESPTPSAFAGTVVVAKDGRTVAKDSASLRESVGRLLRGTPKAAQVASLSESFTFDDGTDAMVILFHRATPKAAPKAAKPRKAAAPKAAPKSRKVTLESAAPGRSVKRVTRTRRATGRKS